MSSRPEGRFRPSVRLGRTGTLADDGDGAGYHPSVVLAGDADRTRAADALREHFVAGRLTLEQLAERTELALKARSRGDLREALADLPRGGRDGVRTALRVAALVVLTGMWVLFSFTLLVVLGLVLLLHGVSTNGLVAFVLVWLVPTLLLGRFWRHSRIFRVDR